ncbi:uracil-DNA glycosylase family protein [Cellulomonas sp. URHE0023]|uniref:uracil-DNA glycosylase family protein n=1 Tax=Cellulomonas sp. URHE0023 TaxID=1380354 RepID=UPI0004859BB2|nr:uracil-DNA glycosylase family protein [Cellulomonas sp. URHE0023]
MAREFDPGYRGRYRPLVLSYPAETVYPADAFRVEWGPIFHRGRLDGSARVLVIGQDPAAHETITRRILVGEAGQRAQGLLARLGITRSYVFINTFLYSVYGQGGGAKHIADPDITRYRNRWIDATVKDQQIEAVISLGQLADKAYQAWRTTPLGASSRAPYATVRHPTYPESASATGTITKAAAFQKLCESWNQALDALHGAVTPDVPVALRHYGTTITAQDLAPIPDADLPPGLPAWMGDLDAWAARTGEDTQKKRATITVTVPTRFRTWPAL